MKECFTSFLESFRYQIGARKFNEMMIPVYEVNTFQNGRIVGGMYRRVIIPNNNAFAIKVAYRNTAGEYQIKKELAIYRKAEKEKLQDWFARPLGYGNWGRFFYCAFTYIPNVGKVPEMFGEYGVLTKEECESCNSCQLEDAQYYIKSKEYRDLLDNFCVVNEVNDLHEGNFGFSETKNHIVFTDYAGYGGIPESLPIW